MKALSQTKKRGDEDRNRPAKHINRTSIGSEMIAYLKEKAERELNGHAC